jgi:hypothetical protein
MTTTTTTTTTPAMRQRATEQASRHGVRASGHGVGSMQE